MSIEIMTQVWKHSNQKGASLLLLLAIADNANDAGIAWPSIPTLAKKIRMSERYTQSLIKELVEAGELTVKTGSRYGISSNTYRVIPVNPTSPVKDSSPLKGAEPVNPASPTGEPQFTQGVIPASPKPSFNHQLTSREEEAASTPVLSMDRQAEALFCKITNFVSIPPGEIKRLDQIIGFIQAYGYDKSEQALTAAYQTWRKTPRKNGGGTYRGTNLGWVDWAQDALAGNGAAEQKDPMQMTHAEFIAYYEAKAQEAQP